jgi:glycosyltransferase involved in cell wall biosynthesis
VPIDGRQFSRGVVLREVSRRSARKKPLRILIVGHNRPGGQANHAAELCAALGHEPGLAVSFLPVTPLAPPALRPLQRVQYLRTLVTSLIYMGKLLTHVPRHDVVHVYSAATSSFFISSAPAILVASLLRRKIVLNYHSGRAEEQLRSWRRTSTAVMRLAHEIAVPSGFLVDVFARYGLHARAIPNHVDLERFRFRERRPLRPVFLWNRHFHAIYNVGCVVRAFALIQREYPGARLTLAGVGPERGEIEALVSDLDLRNVDFAGRVPPAKMPALCDAADILLNASNTDNMPLSIIEAFAAGLPVVSTDAGGIPRLVSDRQTGLIVPVGDHEALAKAALLLLADESLSAKIARRARRECESYSWKAVRSAWIKLYTDLAQMPGGAPRPHPPLHVHD